MDKKFNPNNESGKYLSLKYTSTLSNEIIAYNWDEDKYYLIPYSTGLDGTIQLGEAKEQTQVFNDIIKAANSRIFREILGELEASSPGPSMKIWGTGIHNVYVNDEPSRVKVTPETIPDTFQVFQDELEKNDGITIGVDHIPKELLTEYPTLAKLNLLDVGKITEIGYNEDSIYATKSEHTSPLVAELYAQGELENVSIVAPIIGEPCEDEDADYLLKGFKGIKRTDYVDEGGCRSCKTGLVPDDLVLTAKLAMEEDNVTEGNNKEGTAGNPAEGSGEGTEGNPGEEGEGTQSTNVEGTPEGEPTYITKKEFNEGMTELKDLITSTAGNTEEVKAGLSKFELKAKKAEIGAKIDAKMKDGFITPAMKGGVMMACLALKDTEEKTADEQVDTMLASFTEKVWNPEQQSRPGSGSDEKFDYHKAKKEAGL